MKNKTLAFTMAEVLVVISILGVIAALTVPSLMKNHQRRMDITTAKKAEYDIYQIALRLQAECPRLRDNNCSNNNVNTNLTNLLEGASNSNVTYTNNGLQVNVAIKGVQDSLQYTFNADGSVAVRNNKSAHDYICTKYENEKECK